MECVFEVRNNIVLMPKTRTSSDHPKTTLRRIKKDFYKRRRRLGALLNSYNYIINLMSQIRIPPPLVRAVCQAEGTSQEA